MNKVAKYSAFFATLIMSGSPSVLVAQSSMLQAIRPAGAPVSSAPYSPGILAGGTLYISGQGSLDAEGKHPADFPDQVRQALHNVRNTLQAAGMDYGNITWLNIYLVSSSDIDAMDKVYWGEIGSDPPARTVLVVAALPNQERIEINCIAVKDRRTRHSIWPTGWPRGRRADPPAVQAGDVVYLSAQSGRDPVTGEEPGTFPEEMRQALDHVQTIMAAAGLSMKNVLWVNPYMSVSGQYDAMGNVYRTFFEFGNTPGRGTIQVMALPHQEHIVFSCIAGTDLAKRRAVRPRNMPPSATASPGILYGNTLYLSAKDGFIPGQGIVTQDFDLQLRQSMRNLLDGLEEVNMSFSEVVFSTVYLRQMQDYGRMNALYRTFFSGTLPARTTLQQNEDFGAEDAEQISFIAVKTGSH